MAVSTLSKNQWLDLGKVCLYVAISAIISYLISLITTNPNLVGPLTPVVNVVLVALKKVFTVDQ